MRIFFGVNRAPVCHRARAFKIQVSKLISIIMKRLFILLLISTISFAGQAADLILGSLFQDHMVLQQNTSAPVWGWAAPEAAVEVTLHTSTMGPLVFEGKADSGGKWSIDVMTPACRRAVRYGSEKRYGDTDQRHPGR